MSLSPDANAALVRAIHHARDRSSTTSDIASVVSAAAAPGTSDAQLAAWLMAVRLQGLDDSLAGTLCADMAGSGTQLEWPEGDQPIVDKHSTGGVGDKVSLILAPLMAAAGHRVPMLSGRSLGLTGGTLDKLEAIDGFTVDLDPNRAQTILADTGCFIAAATATLAPADARLYRLRDVTATIDSVPLICASILSKKLAAGVKTLVLDVKYGSGAFMTDLPSARRLASAMVTTGTAAGMDVRAALTPMDSPLGTAVGNAAEVLESLRVLDGEPGPLRDLVIDFAVELSAMAGTHLDAGAFARLLDNGAAHTVFLAMCNAQGATTPLTIAEPAHRKQVRAPRSGPGRFDAHGIAVAASACGATRSRPGDTVDLSASIDLTVPGGANVNAGEPIAVVGGAARDAVDAAAALAADAWQPVTSGLDAASGVTEWIGRPGHAS